MEFGKKAEPEDFLPGSNLFDLNMKFSLESGAINNWLNTTALAIFQDVLRETGDKAEAEKTALSNWKALENDIKRVYGTTKIETDRRIFRAAKNGALSQECPSSGAVRTWRIAFFVALLAEISVLAAQALLTTDFNPFVLVAAGLLGFGGWFQGLGLGIVQVRNWQAATGRKQADPTQRLRYVLFLVLGSMLILSISLLRASGAFGLYQSILVFLVTLFLGEAVAACEAMAKFNEEKRKVILEEMGLAQDWHAVSTHLEWIHRQIYHENYEAYVREASVKGIESMGALAAKAPSPIAE